MVKNDERKDLRGKNTIIEECFWGEEGGGERKEEWRKGRGSDDEGEKTRGDGIAKEEEERKDSYGEE